MNEEYRVEVKGRSERESQILTVELEGLLRQSDRSVRVERAKSSNDTMDLGTVLGIVCGSTAAAAVGRGVAAFLAKRQSAKITIRKNGDVVAEGVTSADAVRLGEIFSELNRG